MEYILCIDTETTGLPKKRNSNYKNIDNYNTCRMVSIAWILYDTINKQIVKKYSNIVKPIGFTINNKSGAALINHITQELATEKGILTELIFQELFNDLLLTKTIVAHNFDFDKGVILSECFRSNNTQLIDLFLSKKSECTLELSRQYNINNRYMKLIDLEYHLFNESNCNHNAQNDAESCLKCYCKIMIKDDEIKVDEIVKIIKTTLSDSTTKLNISIQLEKDIIINRFDEIMDRINNLMFSHHL